MKSKITKIQNILKKGTIVSLILVFLLSGASVFQIVFADDDDVTNTNGNDNTNTEAGTDYVDSIAPTLTISAGASNRYRVGDEIIINATTSEAIDIERSVRPELNISFTKSGMGKYNSGTAVYLETIQNTDETEKITYTYKYKYVIQAGDEGYLIYDLANENGKIVDIAGNETILEKYPQTLTGDVSLDVTKLSSNTTIKYTIYKKEKNKDNYVKIEDFSKNTYFEKGDSIKVETEFSNPLYTSWGATELNIAQDKNKAPRLSIKCVDNKKNTYSDSEQEKYFLNYYDYTVNSDKRITYLFGIEEEENARLFALRLETNIDLYEKIDNNFNKIETGIWGTGISKANLFVHNSGITFDRDSKIYADTKAPEVKIIPELLTGNEYDFNSSGTIDVEDVEYFRNQVEDTEQELPRKIKENGDINHDGEINEDDATALEILLSKNSTNLNTIKYKFVWNEEVTGFTADSITVNNGHKGTLSNAVINNDDGTYTYTMNITPDVATGNSGSLQVIVEQNTVKDTVGNGNIRSESVIKVDKVLPKLENAIAYKEDNKIIVEATYDEAILAPYSSKIDVKFGEGNLIRGEGTYDNPIILFQRNKVKYVYNISGIDGGKVNITLKDSVKDIAGNNSEIMNVNIENNIEPLERKYIEFNGSKYSFGKNGKYINDYTVPTYFKSGDRIKIKENETNSEYDGIIPTDFDLSQMKYMEPFDIIGETEGQNERKFKFSAESMQNNDEINITNANIFFDTKAPVVITEVKAKNPKEGLYKAGDELTIIATSSEEVESLTPINPTNLERYVEIEPEINVKFNNNEGKFNKGKAEFVNATTIENGRTSWVYRYVISDGDEGTIGLSYAEGIFVKDLAGNITMLSDLNGNNNYFRTNGIIADATKPTVSITAKKKVGTTTTNIENNITNADVIEYTFTWSESVLGFLENDITVNNGNKGTLSKAVVNTDGTVTYTMDIIPSVEKGNTGDIQVIIEKDAVNDKAGYGNVRTESVIRVDKQSPILISLEAYGTSTIGVDSNVDKVKQYYKAGDTVRIVATFSENIEGSTAPTLNLQFSESGNAGNTVSVESKVGNKITYKYIIKDGDNGTLSVKGFSGTVKDTAGNETIVTKRALDGDTIIADIKAPELVSLTAIAPEFEYNKFVNEEPKDSIRYGVESKHGKNTITIIAEYSENVYGYNNTTNNIKNITPGNNNAPKLVLEFSQSGKAKANTNGEATFIKCEENKLYYTYDITADENGENGDNGNLKIKSIIGTVYDIAGNNYPTTANTSLPGLIEYRGNTKLEGNDHIVADTTKPSYTISATAVDKDEKLNEIRGNGNYYRKGSIITITAKTNQYIYKYTNTNKELDCFSKENAPRLTVKFGNAAGIGQVQCTNVQYSGDNTIFTYQYEIKENDNGELTATIAVNTGYDIALNGNYKGELLASNSNIIADTVNPVTNWQSWVESEGYGIEDKGNGTWKVTFSEKLYTYNDISHTVSGEVSTSEAPRLLVSNDNTTPLGTTISKIETVNDKTVITYTYSPYTKNIGVYGMKFASVSDKAGNLFNFKDQVPPELSSIKVTNPETGIYKAGTEVTIVATFSEKVTGIAPTLKLKFGDTEAKGTVSSGIIVDNTITYKYTITDEDNGKLQVLSYSGTGLKDLYDNKWVAPETVNISENSITADTIAPTAVISSDVERTNKNKVTYTFTWSEPVIGFTANDIEVVNGIKGTFERKDGNDEYAKVYTLEVDSTLEGRQIVNVRSNICTDRAGNLNEERTTYNNVIIDYKAPEIRAKVNGGNYVINTDKDSETNKNISALKETIVVNEEISKFEYIWSNSEMIPESNDGWITYTETSTVRPNSDIQLNTKVENIGKYYLYIKVTDIAGNTFSGRTNPFIVSNEAITITKNIETTINNEMIATVSYGPSLIYNRKAGIQGKTQSSDSTKVILTENGTVYAEATDINGNKVYATLAITNIDITTPIGTIAYETLSDGKVKATISFNKEKVTITNNGGRNTYTFEKNGEFTFEFEDAAGNRGTAKATVTSIPETIPEPQDTTAPEITFNYTTTTSTVGSRIGSTITTNEDAKISYKWNNGEWKTSNNYIRSYNITYTPVTSGTYTLYAKAEDKAGNITDIKTLQFTITNSEEDIQKPEIVFENLTVLQKNGVKYVKVSPTLTTSVLTSKMNRNMLSGKTPTYTKLTSDNKLKTGSEISLEGVIKYIVIVNGDVNCDGKVEFVNDIIKLNNYRLGRGENLSEIQILAGDINNNGAIDFIPDIVAINNYRLGRINSL